MEELDPTMDGSSADTVAENVEALKQLLPEVFTEAGVDFDALRETLGVYVDDRPERYSFTWNGKGRARRIAQTPSTGTLRPSPDESVDWDTTDNLFIEGDNLEVLKLLQKSYHRLVKMIYIDPPYNTGNEFIYPDKFEDNLNTYLRYTGQVDEEGLKLSPNSETSGRYHTNWLNMMYPRLRLSRNLLREDGAVFISINDVEAPRLRMMCDEIFGEENFICVFVWQFKKGGGSDNRSVVNDHEYVICYAKNVASLAMTKLEVPAEPLDRRDERGAYRRGREMNKWGSNSRRQDRPTMYFPVPGPSGQDVYPIRNDGAEGCWRWGRKGMMDLVLRGDAEFDPREDGTFIVYEKIRSEAPRAKPFRTWLDSTGQTADGSKLVTELFDGRRVFDYPKPLGLLQQLIALGTSPTERDLVLDFFAGSATTAEAVMRANQEDMGSRRFIMIQLPERCAADSEAAAAGFDTIADIGKERIRRAAAQIRANGESLDGADLGFRVLGLDSSNIVAWDGSPEDLESALFDAVENIKPDRSEQDVLFELLLKYGLDLATPVERREVATASVYVIGAGALVVCLSDDVTLELAGAIAAIKAELSPEVMRVVFKDSGFSSDVVKANTVQILRQAGIDDVKSL